MRLNRLGANLSELILKNGDIVLISYDTPVAARIDGDFFRTEKKWSKTTSKHINGWLHDCKGDVLAETKEQEFFYNLMN